MKIWKKILIVIASVVLIGAIGCGIYISDYYHAEDEAFEAICNEDEAVIETEIKNDQIIFAPQNKPKAGLIFYPGGKVQYEAYAPLMEAFAREGILSIVVHMPGNLAVLNMDAAEDVKKMYPEVENWYIGGHSLGGAMAASYVSEHVDVKMESYEENKENIPEDFVEVVIEGGCHSGFAYYGEQDGDGVPQVTQDEQIEKTVEVFLENVKL